MTLAHLTRDATAAYALSLIGRTRDRLPVPWTASAVMDDCAAFCSHVLWNGKPGPVIWVDGFKSAGDGSYGGGATDLAPWDVLLFDWDGNGIGNHVEFYVSADPDPRYVRTYGANGSDTKAAAYRRRPKSYILGRFRPNYTAQSAPLDHTLTTPVGDIVTSHIVHIDSSPRTKQKGTYDSFLANPDNMRCLHLNATQERYWINKQVPLQGGVQPPQVLDGFEQVKGKGGKL